MKFLRIYTNDSPCPSTKVITDSKDKVLQRFKKKHPNKQIIKIKIK